MKDLYCFFKEFGSSVNDRLKFPLFNAFLISWAILNWQSIFIMLFSEQSIENRILLVNEENTDLGTKFYWPLILAIAYTILTPLVKRGFYWMLSRINQDNRDNDMTYLISSYRKKIELAQAEVRLEVEREKHRELRNYNDVVEKLQAEVESEKEEKENLRIEIKEILLKNEELLKKHKEDYANLFDRADFYKSQNQDLYDLVKSYDRMANDILNNAKRLIFDRESYDETAVSQIFTESEKKLIGLKRLQSLFKSS